MNEIVQRSLFDYTGVDAETRAVVQEHTQEIKMLVRRSLQDAIEIGDRLMDVKWRLGHGSFGRWLISEFGWSESSALKFMQVAEKFKTVKFTDLDIAPSAAYLLAAPSTPEPAFTEAAKRAQDGENITHKLAKRIVNKYKPEIIGSAGDEVADFEPDVYAGKADTPLKTFFRYPGGKSKIAGALVKEIVSLAKDGDEYREPFVGGGGIFLPVLSSRKFKRIWINDMDHGIYCVWLSVKSFCAEMTERVRQFSPTVELFYSFRETLNKNCLHLHPAEVALMKIAVHQMSYSGLGTRAGGPIGGAGQKSQYDVGCRWSAENIIKQIEAAHHAMRGLDVVITSMDYRAMMGGDNVVMYLDPPYYEQGRNLYHIRFTEQDHKELADRLRIAKHPWLLSYDKCDDVRGLYAWANMRETEEIHYSISLKNGSAGKRSRFASEYLIDGG